MISWKNIPSDSDFTLHNIPFGIFSTKRRTARVGVAIGDEIIDLAAISAMGLMEDLELEKEIFSQDSLNRFMALGKDVTRKVRHYIQDLLTDPDSPIKEYPSVFAKQSNASMHLPVEIGDYTDFYSSREHATNVGKLFRDPENALLPNWLHLPVAYHGRASSIIVSGENFHRPQGQILGADRKPVFGPSKRLDFELEMAFIVGKGTNLGETVATSIAEDHIFGMVLFNDWSARDIQSWEYVPLGPFLGKNFASSISPWVITLDALEPFKVAGPAPETNLLPYLKYSGNSNYDIDLSVSLTAEDGEESSIVQSNSKYLYWNIKQQLAHHTINGCNLRTGDMMATGTISGPDPKSYGSMLELSQGGKSSIPIKNGERIFLKDYDTVTIRGRAQKDDIKVGFGEVSGQVLPTRQ